MAENFRPGQHLSARHVNNLSESVDAVMNITGDGVNFTTSRQGVTAQKTDPPSQTPQGLRIIGKNVSEVDLSPFQPAVVNGAPYGYDDPGIFDKPVVHIYPPQNGNDYLYPAVVPLDHIPAGTAGECWVMGTVLVQVIHDITQYDFGTVEEPLYPSAFTAKTVVSNGSLSDSYFVASPSIEDPGYTVLWEEPVDYPWLNWHYALVLLGGGGGTGSVAEEASRGQFSCPTVYTLPEIPTTAGRFRMVFWTNEVNPDDSEEVGTGDNKVWWTRTGLTRWYPFLYTTKAGTPAEPEEE